MWAALSTRGYCAAPLDSPHPQWEGTMIAPAEKPTVKLLGYDGNAFIILGKVMKALRDNGADDEYVRTYLEEAKDGD